MKPLTKSGTYRSIWSSSKTRVGDVVVNEVPPANLIQDQFQPVHTEPPVYGGNQLHGEIVVS